MARHHFLCCLPIRLGAFVISLLTMAYSGFLTFISICVIIDVRKGLVSTGQTRGMTTGIEIMFGVLAVSYGLLFMSALFGLIGVLSHRISWIHTFNSFMKTILFLNLSAGVTAIVLFAIDKKNICVNGNSSSNAKSCPSFLGTASRDLIIVIASLILAVVLLLQGYGIWIVSDCIDDLETKQVAEYPFATRYAGVAPVPPSEDSIPLTNGKGY
ncbi:Tetraspannin domain-containing protein [Lentinula edodes]|uniref:Tetraspannin domain-containing protein n=1 Tax=Lentinula edodes TaxID=5353 RepID=A0A1Q3EEH2_LENED|nr:Tetraspannin domain-containing protein [Lentinula edodes]